MKKPIKSLMRKKKRLKDYIDQREQGLIPTLPKGFMSPYEVRNRYDMLIQKSYQLQDFVGKDGIEKTFDQKLRGSPGKLRLEMKRTGDVITTLPGSYDKTPPAKIELSIDYDLQKVAEELLAERETDDELFPRGGAICIINLKNQQVLALASYPRFNPQDFIDKNSTKIHRWTESNRYIDNIYEGIWDLEKEQYDAKTGFYEKKEKLSFSRFLKRIVSESSFVYKILKKLTVKEAYLARDAFEKLYEKYGFGDIDQFIDHFTKNKFQDDESKDFVQELGKIFEDNSDPILTLDLIGLLIDTKKLNSKLINIFQSLTLEDYFDLYQKTNLLEDVLKTNLKAPFETLVFEPWKKKSFQSFFKAKKGRRERKKNMGKTLYRIS